MMIMRHMPLKVRYAVSFAISLVPLNSARILLHRLIYDYRISWSARIGFAVVLAVDKAYIGKASVLRFNRFEGPFSLFIEDGVHIGSSNRFTCLLNTSGRGHRLRYCKIGENTCIA